MRCSISDSAPSLLRSAVSSEDPRVSRRVGRFVGRLLMELVPNADVGSEAARIFVRARTLCSGSSLKIQLTHVLAWPGNCRTTLGEKKPTRIGVGLRHRRTRVRRATRSHSLGNRSETHPSAPSVASSTVGPQRWSLGRALSLQLGGLRLPEEGSGSSFHSAHIPRSASLQK